MSLPRLLTSQINKWLFKGKALIITGARQVGKTTLLKELFQNRLDLLWLDADESFVREQLSVYNKSHLKQVIGKNNIVIIDEVQRIENAGLLLKILVDQFKTVQIIVTGSSSIDIANKIFEPLTGRYIRFSLFPLMIQEVYTNQTQFEIEQQLPYHLVYGLYPEIAVRRDVADVLLKNLTSNYLYKDVLYWENVRKPEILDKLLHLLAFQVGSEVSLNELASQLKIKSDTVERYLYLLEQSFVIYRLKSYSTNERKELNKSSKVYFCDNGIRNAIIGNLDDITQRQDIGLLWENLIVSERIKRNSYANSEAKSFFWRNYNQSEVDYIEKSKSVLSAFEFKWNDDTKAKVSLAFRNMYPKAVCQVIHRKNFLPFVSI
jgi:hypothetical protein